MDKPQDTPTPEKPVERKTTEELETLWKHRHDLVEPVIPLDYVDNVLCCDASDCLLGYLIEHLEPEAGRLFNGVIFGYLYQEEIREHKGKVTRETAEAMAKQVPEMLRDMSKLGMKW
jgi:hypothetical protein